MKKSMINLLIIFVLVMFLPSNVEAKRPYEIKGRKECEKIELATALTNGELEHVECFEDYDAAKNKMDEIGDNDNLVIIEDGIIINAKYALIDYDQAFFDQATYGNKEAYLEIFESIDSKKSYTYIRTAELKADDAVLLEYNYSAKKAKIKVSGVVGWVKDYDGRLKTYDIVPIAWVNSAQYYNVTSTTLYHALPNNVYDSTSGVYSFSIDQKPSMLNVGKYYSYDGHYFYTDIKTMIKDYKNNTYDNSVNKDKPYYNYYLYLSFRSKTNYNASNINDYLNVRLNGNPASKLYNTGEYFYWVQEHYGVNAIMMMAIAINESGNGYSEISQTKNNLFGLNAFDATPGQSANYFTTVKDCIETYGYSWMSYWYLQPGDLHFRGANLGNKGEGLNVKYASDAFWGEKAAHYYYEIDKRYGFQDRNNLLLAVLNDNYNDTVYGYKSVGGVKVNPHLQYTIRDSVVIVLEQLKDSKGNIWYKIQNDPNLDSNLDYIGDSKSNPRIEYNFEGYVYVEAKYFTLISNPDDYNPNNVTEVIDNKPVDDNGNSNENKTEEKQVLKTINSVMTGANYKYNNGIVSGIKLGTKIKDITSILVKQGATSVNITDINGKKKSSNIISTGDKISVVLDDKVDTVSVVIYGDINGDGSISASDYVKIKNHIMGSKKLDSVYESAADYNGDGNISASDYVKIKNYIMGK